MDNGPDQQEDDVTRVDLPVTRPEPSGQVRIVGAEPAGEATTELPAVPGLGDEEHSVDDLREGAADEAEGFGEGAGDWRVPGLDQPSVRITDEPVEADAGVQAVQPVEPGQTATPSGAPASMPASTELPHWTEPPTGEVPEVLVRGSAGEGSAAEAVIIPPSWREEDADWVAHEEEFEPAMFGGEHASLGSLDETGGADAERRPWEFDLDSKPGGPGAAPVRATDAPSDPPEGSRWTEAADREVEARRVPSEERLAPPAPAGDGDPGWAGDGPAPAVEEVAAVHDAGTEEGAATRPTGTVRPGRARRSGLRPGRLRAKRPDDLDPLVDAPLAAEPPGAAVTEVPGAGRKRMGVVGLAAADRTAERESDLLTDGPDPGSGVGALDDDAGALGAAAARTPRRRGPRRSTGGRSAPEAAVSGTGGGPPAPRRARRASGERPASSPEPGRRIGLRVGTGIAVAIVALAAFKLGTVASLVLVAVVVTFAAGECFGVLRRAGYHPATLLGLVGTVSLMVGAYMKGVAALPLVLALITVFTLLWYVFGIERGSAVAGTAATLLTVGWVSLLGSYAGLLLSPSAFPDRHGIAFLLGAVIATVANDIGALVVGGWLGRRPLAPSISPNKTWEGLLGGAVFSILFSALVTGNIHPWTPARAALLGVVVAVVAPAGDLCESLLKRDLRLKDMGRLLPGHGGVLDRVDALLFVLPATYYLVRALNIA